MHGTRFGFNSAYHLCSVVAEMSEIQNKIDIK